MATKKAAKKGATKAATKAAKKAAKKALPATKVAGSGRPIPAPRPPAPPVQACSKLFDFFQNVSIGPGQYHDSGTPRDVDCYQWLHVWVRADHPQSFAMDNIGVEIVFELPGKMGATGLADLSLPHTPMDRPIPMQTNSGQQVGGYGTFIMRVAVVGPGVRVIVINNGANTYDFSVWGYATH